MIERLAADERVESACVDAGGGEPELHLHLDRLEFGRAGFDTRGEAVRSAWIYSPRTGRWRAGPRLARPVAMVGAVAARSRIYAVSEGVFESYAAGRGWRLGPALAVPRHALGLFASAGRLLLSREYIDTLSTNHLLSITIMMGLAILLCICSEADAFVAATARETNATLLHKDPEFESLRGRIKLKALPYKAHR